MRLIYVTGGAKSGKSKFAEDLLLSMNDGAQKNVYLATSVVFDEEMERKVELHRQRRQDKWITVEAYKNFARAFGEKKLLLERNPQEDGILKNNILVDCLTNMISNIIFEETNIDWDKASQDEMTRCDRIVEKEVESLLENLENFENVLIVSNELGLGMVPTYPLGRYFREIAGRINQMVAERADEAYFVVSGIPVKIKGGENGEKS